MFVTNIQKNNHYTSRQDIQLIRQYEIIHKALALRIQLYTISLIWKRITKNRRHQYNDSTHRIHTNRTEAKTYTTAVHTKHVKSTLVLATLQIKPRTAQDSLHQHRSVQNQHRHNRQQKVKLRQYSGPPKLRIRPIHLTLIKCRTNDSPSYTIPYRINEEQSLRPSIAQGLIIEISTNPLDSPSSTLH
jgi:hypothetical protein